MYIILCITERRIIKLTPVYVPSNVRNSKNRNWILYREASCIFLYNQIPAPLPMTTVLKFQCHTPLNSMLFKFACWMGFTLSRFFCELHLWLNTTFLWWTFTAGAYFTACIHQHLTSLSFMCHLGDFQFGAVMNDVAVNILVYVPCARPPQCKSFSTIHTNK